MERFWIIVLIFSLIFNFVLAMGLFASSFHWRVSERYGVLTEDVQVGFWAEKDAKPFLTIPKGTTVMDVSNSNQIDQFEPHRFSITVTSDREIVDYNSTNVRSSGSLYTGDGWDK